MPEMNIKDAAGGNIGDIFPGGKIQVPEGMEFRGDKFDYKDVWNMVVQAAKETDMWKNAIDIDMVILDFRRGDTKTIAYVFFTVIIALFIAYAALTSLFESIFADTPSSETDKKEEVVERDPPRDFTMNQIREFDGTKGNPIYIGLCGEVYDVSDRADFYGEGCTYHCFAGRDASRAMARLSFDEEDLSNNDVSDLGPFERSQLEDWVQKFKYYNNYPIVGKISMPPAQRDFRRAELVEYKGLTESPAGRIDAPIYIGINGKVLDVSYGGKEMYGKGGPYFLFAGIDASKALAKMSFDKACLDSSDLSDLTAVQLKTLNDWEKKFVAVRKYPVVGRLLDEEGNVVEAVHAPPAIPVAEDNSKDQ